MTQNVSETGEIFRLELLHRASEYGDLEAWVAFQKGLEETVLAWFHRHPASKAASRLQRESDFVKQAFEQFWHIVIQEQVRCETEASVLVCLRACLNGAILEALRVSCRGAVYEQESAEQNHQEHTHTLEIWNRVQAMLSSERERRLAYLFYHCGLKPAEIVRDCPQEWSDVHEIARLRHSILTSLYQLRYMPT